MHGQWVVSALVVGTVAMASTAPAVSPTAPSQPVQTSQPSQASSQPVQSVPAESDDAGQDLVPQQEWLFWQQSQSAAALTAYCQQVFGLSDEQARLAAPLIRDWAQQRNARLAEQRPLREALTSQAADLRRRYLAESHGGQLALRPTPSSTAPAASTPTGSNPPTLPSQQGSDLPRQPGEEPPSQGGGELSPQGEALEAAWERLSQRLAELDRANPYNRAALLQTIDAVLTDAQRRAIRSRGEARASQVAARTRTQVGVVLDEAGYPATQPSRPRRSATTQPERLDPLPEQDPWMLVAEHFIKTHQLAGAQALSARSIAREVILQRDQWRVVNRADFERVDDEAMPKARREQLRQRLREQEQRLLDELTTRLHRLIAPAAKGTPEPAR